MKNIFKIVVVLIIFLSVGWTNISAQSIDKNTKAVSTPVYYWQLESKGYNKKIIGCWRNGPVGKGKSKLNISSSTTINRTVTNSICGSYPVGVGSISAYLGVTIGKSITYGTSYIITVPAGKKQQIIFRPVYKQYKVNQRQWVKTGSVKSKTKNVKTAYENVFDYWEYSYKNVK